MADPGCEADVFAIPHLWQSSKWLENGQETPGQFFSAQLVGLADIDSSSSTHESNQPGFSDSFIGAHGSDTPLLQLTAPVKDDSGFFRLPYFSESLAEAQTTPVLPSDNIPGEAFTSSDLGEIEPYDLWTDADTPSLKPPSYKTWDGFMSGEHPTSQPLYLSEAGPAAYDALLNWDTDPLDLRDSGVPVVETRTYLASLLSLAVGRESVFFTRSHHTFKPAIPSVRLSGYSSNALRGLETKCLQCGETFLGLRAFIQTTYTKKSGRCTVALSSALDRILQILQQQLDIEAQRPRSLLQLQSTINNASGVLQPLKFLMGQVAQARADENVLSTVFKHACVMEFKEAFVREIMQEILRVVSVPWLELLEEWIGTKIEQGLPFTKDNVGEVKGFVKVESETCIDDFGEEFEDIDFRLDQDRLPEFFPADIAQLAFDTGKNLRFIKRSCPDHALFSTQTSARQPCKAPRAEWTFGWDEVLHLERKVASYHNELKSAVVGLLSPESDGLISESQPRRVHGPNTSLFGSNESQIEGMILASMEQFEAPVRRQTFGDRFSDILDQNLRNHFAPSSTRSAIAAPHPSLLPILSFGGIISAQAEVINRESLRLLFDAHNLRDHLDLQRSFQLLGNGMFCTQLSHALFDPDLETAERQAGIARQGGVMGLRLGARDTWPPASSELRLALMGILTDSFNAEHGSADVSTAPSRETDGLPGDLSFAVRDLGPEDVEKCMNPDSLEALDFLRLAYTAPPELRVIITPVILVQYDRVFKFLVRLLRLMFVVDQLFRVVNLKSSAWHEPSNTAYRFSREVRHFVSCISAYFLDTGIAGPWATFQAKMDQMQAELKHDGAAISEKACSPETLGEYHAQALNRIMTALFLRKRQQPVLKLLEDIFVAILTYAKHARLQALGVVVDGEHTIAYSAKLYKDFKKKVQVFITVCRTLTEKTRSGNKEQREGTGHSDGLGEDSMVAQLLLKLDMNNYYTKPS